MSERILVISEDSVALRVLSKMKNVCLFFHMDGNKAKLRTAVSKDGTSV